MHGDCTHASRIHDHGTSHRGAHHTRHRIHLRMGTEEKRNGAVKASSRVDPMQTGHIAGTTYLGGAGPKEATGIPSGYTGAATGEVWYIWDVCDFCLGGKKKHFCMIFTLSSRR